MDEVWAMLEKGGARRWKGPSGPWYILTCALCKRSCSGPKGETRCAVCRGEITKEQAAERDARKASKRSVLVSTESYSKRVNGKLVERITRTTTYVDPPKSSALKVEFLD